MSSTTVQDDEDGLEDVAVIYPGEIPSLDDNMDPVQTVDEVDEVLVQETKGEDVVGEGVEAVDVGNENNTW